jgi:hypothetical protein
VRTCDCPLLDEVELVADEGDDGGRVHSTWMSSSHWLRSSNDLRSVRSNVRMTPTADRKYTFVIERNCS